MKDQRPTEAKIRELYLGAFSREPRPKELETAIAYLAEFPIAADGKPVDPANTERDNFQDLIWALINTKEFLYNH